MEAAAAAQEGKQKTVSSSSGGASQSSQAPSTEPSGVSSAQEQQGQEGEEGEGGEKAAPARRFGAGLRVHTTPDRDDDSQGVSLQRKTLSEPRSATPESVVGLENGPDVQPIFRMLMSDRYDTMADTIKVR